MICASNVEMMALLFSRDYSLEAIASHVGVHRETVRRTLIGLGINTNYHDRKSIGASKYGALARELRGEGLPWSAISDRLGFSERQLRRYVAA